MIRIYGLVALMLVPAALPAQAEDNALPPEWEGMVGTWTLEEEDGDTFSCDITLLGERGIGGYTLDIPETCADTFPTSDIAAWTINEQTNSVEFIDALRNTVLVLGEMGDGGLYGSDIADPPQYFLVHADQ